MRGAICQWIPICSLCARTISSRWPNYFWAPTHHLSPGDVLRRWWCFRDKSSNQMIQLKKKSVVVFWLLDGKFVDGENLLIWNDLADFGGGGDILLIRPIWSIWSGVNIESGRSSQFGNKGKLKMNLLWKLKFRNKGKIENESSHSMIDRDCLRLRFGVNEMEWMRVHNFWGINFLLRLSFELAKTSSTIFCSFLSLSITQFSYKFEVLHWKKSLQWIITSPQPPHHLSTVGGLGWNWSQKSKTVLTELPFKDQRRLWPDNIERGRAYIRPRGTFIQEVRCWYQLIQRLGSEDDHEEEDKDDKIEQVFDCWPSN